MAAIAPAALASSDLWLRAETPRFIVYSNGSETGLRNLARDLESFDALLGRMINAPPSPASAKLEVFLFRNTDQFYEAYGARNANIDGFYFPAPELIGAISNYRDAQATAAQTTLFHEYTHHFMFAHAPGAYPAWYVEGFAEFASTALFQDNRIVLGRSISERMSWLNGDQWLPLERILVADPLQMDSGEEMARFYAQSWLLTHYISLTPGEIEHFRAYVAEFRRGADPVASFQTAFGKSTGEMQTALREYARHPPALALNRPAAVEHTDATVTTMPASTDALIALWVRVRRGAIGSDHRDEVAATVRARVASAASDRFSEMLLARTEATIGDHQRARSLLQPYLAAHADDVEATFLMGLSYYNDAHGAEGEAQQTALAQARHYFVAAYRLDQNYVPALYRYVETFEGQPMTEAAMQNTANVILLAHQLAPQVSSIGFMAAEYLMSLDRAAEAVPILRAIAYDPHGGDGAKQARDLLQQAEAAAAQQVAATAHAPGAQH
jgi:hypothetical protein